MVEDKLRKNDGKSRIDAKKVMLCVCDGIKKESFTMAAAARSND